MEEWKIIPFEPQYEVSNTGKVRNINTKHIKSLRLDRYGYPRVTLYPSGKTYTIHRLVMLSFTDTVNEEINHINGDKEDNRLENLEWCTQAQNARHRDTKLQSKWKGSLNPSAKLTVEEVRKIKYESEGLSNKEVGLLYNTSAENVRRIRKGERWSHI